MTKNILFGLPLILFGSIFPLTSNANTATCGCEPTEVYAGFTGGNGSGSKIRVDCANGKNYQLGDISSPMTKERYAGALGALMGGKSIVILYWDPNPLSCDDVSNNWLWTPAGFKVVK